MKFSKTLLAKMEILRSAGVRYETKRRCFVDVASGKKLRGLTKTLSRMLPVPQEYDATVGTESIKDKRTARFTGGVMQFCGTCKSAIRSTKNLATSMGRRVAAERNCDRAHGCVVDHQLGIYAAHGRTGLLKRCAVVDPCVGALIEQLDAEGLVAYASQTPIYCAEIGRATAIDLLATDLATRRSIVLIEVKATYGMTSEVVRAYERAHGTMTRGALKGMQMSYYTRHQTQLLCMQQMLQRQYGICVDKARVMRLAPGIVHTYPLAKPMIARSDPLFAAILKSTRRGAQRKRRNSTK